MPCSPARLAANRANARKSTGPRTEQGKVRSRENSYKHGLTGAGVVLATEDADQVEARFTVLMEEMAPKTLMGGILVKRAAMLSVRLDRSYEQEASHLSTRVLSAESDLADKRMAEAERLLKTIWESPATNRRRLMAMPEGVALMIARWESLKADLDHPDGCKWAYDHYQMADYLNGRGGGQIDISMYNAWTSAIHGDFIYLSPGRFEGIEGDEEKCRHAANQVADLIDADIARLRVHLAAMDTGVIEAERAHAKGRALFDPSHQANLARKYEAAAERGLYKALQEFREVEAQAPDEPAVAVASSTPTVTAEPAPVPGPSPEPPQEPEAGARPEVKATPRPEPVALGSSFPEAPLDEAPAIMPGSEGREDRPEVGR